MTIAFILRICYTIGVEGRKTPASSSKGEDDMSRKEIKVLNEMTAKGWKYAGSGWKKIGGKWRGVFRFTNDVESCDVIVK